MVKSYLNIDATLDVILKMLEYFKGLPNLKSEKKYKDFIKPYSNIKHRMKLLVNDVYGHLIYDGKLEVGWTVGVQKDKVMHQSQYSKELKRSKDWIFEHGIPWNEFFPLLVKKNVKTIYELLRFLIDNFTCMYVTKPEDKLLNKEYRQSMPQVWNEWSERYNKSGIEIYQLPKKN